MLVLPYDPIFVKQEAQLPLRNRASVMHFFVAKLLSKILSPYGLLLYVYHLRNIRPANLLRTQRINLAWDRNVCLTRDTTVVWCRLSREHLWINFILQKLESLNYMTPAIVLASLYLLLRNCFRNPREVEVGRVANFAGYRIRVPGRYYPAGSGPDPGT